MVFAGHGTPGKARTYHAATDVRAAEACRSWYRNHNPDCELAHIGSRWLLVGWNTTHDRGTPMLFRSRATAFTTLRFLSALVAAVSFTLLPASHAAASTPLPNSLDMQLAPL